MKWSKSLFFSYFLYLGIFCASHAMKDVLTVNDKGLKMELIASVTDIRYKQLGAQFGLTYKNVLMTLTDRYGR